jgi:hypothetical protein
MTATATKTEKVFEVLTGHTSFDTALEVGDYPYGWEKRTTIRYWMERATKGIAKNKTRFVSCTKNPATGRWNKPKGSTYADWGWMIRDHRTGHIDWKSVSAYDLVKSVAKATAEGVWAEVPEDDRDEIGKMIGLVRLKMASYYADWDKEVAAVREAVKVYGAVPDLYHLAGFDGDHKMYKPDYDLALGLVKAEDLGIFTVPELKTTA